MSTVFALLWFVFSVLFFYSLVKKNGKAKRYFFIGLACFIIFGITVPKDKDSNKKNEGTTDNEQTQNVKKEKPTSEPKLTQEQIDQEKAKAEAKTRADAEAKARADAEAKAKAEAEAAAKEAAKPKLTLSQENAISKAEDYLNFTAFSNKGLIEQLKYEGFSDADATFAVNNITVDWNEQALKKGKDYLDMTSFSRSGLIQQLEFDGFTAEQATYAVNTIGL